MMGMLGNTLKQIAYGSLISSTPYLYSSLKNKIGDVAKQDGRLGDIAKFTTGVATDVRDTVKDAFRLAFRNDKEEGADLLNEIQQNIVESVPGLGVFNKRRLQRQIRQNTNDAEDFLAKDVLETPEIQQKLSEIQPPDGQNGLQRWDEYQFGTQNGDPNQVTMKKKKNHYTFGNTQYNQQPFKASEFEHLGVADSSAGPAYLRNRKK